MDKEAEDPEQFTETEVMKAIAEHLQNSKSTVSPVLTSIFNNIILKRTVPVSFKFGILTPVLKKQKDPTIMSNYRDITVTPTIGKTFEYAFLEKLNLKSKTLLQCGFTEGLSPIMSSLLISEARYEIKKSTENFFISVLDVQSAFDVVQHIILMDKALDQNIHPTYWKILTELYDGLSSKVKWMDGLSEPFKIKQGVRQGGILSTHLYKIFVQDLLVENKENRWNGKEHNFNIKERIQIARRTQYALMGSGVHGTNGLNPAISYQIYKTYVIPRLTYGLEVLPLTKSNIEELEIFHRKNLRHLQSLPERTSNAVVLLLLGALPIEAEIHKRQLSLLYSYSIM
ncbi:unnamed protein product [Mytilus coruscus]|uniref:Reverse transcriptase domain-containing protein n=1 Tax=Mytilus coruscus TaxID=42192 RepID=A0A6J8DVI2_MYTCO|nr:unnamed protein product [Mytilus coruscus]